MFQYVWFNKQNYVEKNNWENSKKPDFLTDEDIEYVRFSYWEEHCLECAVPLCYNNCINWVERYDKKCQRFYYGIYHNKRFSNQLYSAELKFRKWGKLESRIFPGTDSLKIAQRLDELNKIISQIVLQCSKAIKLVSPNCKLSRVLEVFKIIFLERFHKRNNLETNTFLLQAYSYEANTYALCIDIKSQRLLFREKMEIKPGYNQIILDLTNKVDLSSIEGLIRIYPENDYESEITILFADFVKLKDKQTQNYMVTNEGPAAKVKCIAWDLDNTLWNGILIECDPENLELRKMVLDTIKQLDAKGIIQVIVSKNNENEAISVLKRLGIDGYFVYTMINWETKSSNISNLAELLKINVNTFALVDDSIFERNEVLSRLPYVRVYDENMMVQLNHLEEFDVPVTEDSKRRRKMYQMEVERKEIKKKYSDDNLEFLRDCKIEIRISRLFDEQTILRSYELVQRTNQLNLSGKKYEKEIFYDLIEKNRENSYVVFCKDKFGEYGQIAFLVVERVNNTLCVVEFAMSCRVAGKYVESALIKWLQKQFADLNIEKIVFKGVNNGRNKLLIDALQETGMVDVSRNTPDLMLEIKSGNAPKHGDIVSVKSS